MQIAKNKKVSVIADPEKVREALERAQRPNTKGDISFIRENDTQRYSVTVLQAQEHTGPTVWRFVGEILSRLKGRRTAVHKIRVRGEYSYETGKGILVLSLS